MHGLAGKRNCRHQLSRVRTVMVPAGPSRTRMGWRCPMGCFQPTPEQEPF